MPSRQRRASVRAALPFVPFVAHRIGSAHPKRSRSSNVVHSVCFALQASLLMVPAMAGTIRTEYDVMGQPIAITDASGQVTRIQRDLLGRPTLITYADGQSSTLVYDVGAHAKGYLSSFTDRSGTTIYTRDIFGHVVTKTQTLASGITQQVGYGYTAAGQLATVTYPNGSTLGHAYDSTGRLVQLNWNGSPLVTGITWNPMGQPTTWTWAFVPGLSASRTYDTAARLTATEFSRYVWDAAGRITSLTQSIFQPGDADPNHSSIASTSTTWSVGYDAVGRITGFNTAGSEASYTYDANGNRTGSVKTVNGQTIRRQYTFEADSNRYRAFGQVAGGAATKVAYRYNANGDLTSDGLRTYSYDAEGRLSAVTTGATDTSPTTRYAHNVLGQRVFKTEPLYPPSEGDEQDPGFFQSLVAFFAKLWAPRTSEAEKQGFAFMYGEDGSLLAETGTGGANSTGSTHYIYLPTANGPMPIAAVIDGNLYAVHSDHLNTPRRLTNANGQVVWQWAYSAFGDEKPTIAKYRFANLDVAPNPGVTSFAEFEFNLRWPGQYHDKESGLYYNGFRSLDPRTGRYTQNDRIGLAGGPNRRAYAAGNPLKHVDRFGLAIGDFPPPPPGYDSGSWTRGAWPNNGKTYLRDRSGNTWTIHPEDNGHWRHWDKQDSDGDDDGTWPPNAKKPWSGQKKLKDGQCETDPSGDAEPWDPARYDYTPDSPRLWIPQWANPRSAITPRYSPSPRLTPRFVLP